MNKRIFKVGAISLVLLFLSACSAQKLIRKDRNGAGGKASCPPVTEPDEDQTPSTATLIDINSIDELRERFNNDSGIPRLILLVSPTCPVCIKGVAWIQENILEPNPSSKLQIYAIWFSMVPDDSRSKWSGSRLPDPRVTHFWDEGKVVGRWFAKYIEPKSKWLIKTKSEVEWDAYYLYGPEASWDKTDKTPSPLISWGRTLMFTRKRLQEGILPLLKKK